MYYHDVDFHKYFMFFHIIYPQSINSNNMDFHKIIIKTITINILYPYGFS